MLQKIFRSYWPLLLILVCVSFLAFARLSAYDFWDWDECIMVEQAREMKVTGNLLTNQWNHLLLFEKPPLNNWLLLLFTGGQVHEASARAVMILLSLLLIASVYVFSKKYFSSRVAILASLLLLTSNLYVLYTVRVNTDIGFALFTFIGFFLWLLSFNKTRLSYLSGIFLGLAVLNKGLSIAPFLLAIGVSIFLDFKKERLINFLKMIAAFLIVVVPWHAYHYLVYGQQFMQVYFSEHLFRRAKYALDFHFEGRLFYFRLLYRDFFPWIFAAVILPFSYLFTYKHYINIRAIRRELAQNQLVFTLLLLILIPLFSITVVKTKIAWYALPLYPFIAIFIAYSIELALQKIRLRKIFFILVVLLVFKSYPLIIRETEAKNPLPVARRNEVFIKASKYPYQEIDYLVQFSERQAKDILPPNQQTSTTFYFGGNPCAVFYSEKKVNYYYSILDFQNVLNHKKGLYVVANGDLHVLKDTRVKMLHQNTDFTLFEK